jgi:acyl carrier protein
VAKKSTKTKASITMEQRRWNGSPAKNATAPEGEMPTVALTVADTVRLAFAEEAGMDFADITEDKRPVEDLELDSLDLVEVAMMIEEACAISIADHVDFNRLQTVGAWVRLAENPPKELEEEHEASIY